LAFHHEFEVQTMPPTDTITLGAEIAPGLRLGCLSLENCLGPTGQLTPWAAAVVAEVWSGALRDGSMRIAFLYRPADLDAVPKRIYDGFYWARGKAAIEVTFRGSGMPPSPVPPEQLIRLLCELGPAFASGASTMVLPEPAATAPPPVDAALLERVLQGVAHGCPACHGMPWSPTRRDRQPRSIRRLLRQLGVDGQAEVPTLLAMRAKGVVSASYRRAKRDYRKGLRTAEGMPAVVWRD
jgi:hypothetical protein